MDIAGIKKVTFQKVDNSTLYSLSEYTVMARKIVSKFAPRFAPGLANVILRDDDAIANITSDIIKADCNWNPDREKSSSRGSYRVQCGIRSIQKYIARRNRNKKKYGFVQSLQDNINENYTLENICEDNRSQNPRTVIENRELITRIHKILDDPNNSLSKSQQLYIRQFYIEHIPVSEITKLHKVTKQWVYLNLHEGIRRIRIILKKHDR